MKQVKQKDKETVCRTLSLSSDSEDSVDSYFSNNSKKSYGKWAKCSKAEICPIDRKVPAMIRNFKAYTPSLSVVDSKRNNYFDLTNQSREHAL